MATLQSIYRPPRPCNKGIQPKSYSYSMLSILFAQADAKAYPWYIDAYRYKLERSFQEFQQIFDEVARQGANAQYSTTQRGIVERLLCNDLANAINDYIFGGCFKPVNCRVHLVWEDSVEWTADDYGSSTTCRIDQNQPLVGTNARNIIHIYESIDAKNSREAFHQYEMTLRHEMAHSFITLFVRDQGVEVERRYEGHTGHGRLWQELAGKIEQRWGNHCDSKLDMGREAGMALKFTEMKNTTREQREKMCKGVGLDANEVETMYQGP